MNKNTSSDKNIDSRKIKGTSPRDLDLAANEQDKVKGGTIEKQHVEKQSVEKR